MYDDPILTKENFYAIQINSRAYHLPIGIEKSWDDAVRIAAVKNDFIIPTLEELLQFINEDKNGTNINIIKEHLQKEWLVTNTRLSDESRSSSQFYTVSVYDAEFRESKGLKNMQKAKLGSLYRILEPIIERKASAWTNIELIGTYESESRDWEMTKLIETLTGLDYKSAISTLNKVYPGDKIELLIGWPSRDNPVSLVKRNDSLGIMGKYGFCGAQCIHD